MIYFTVGEIFRAIFAFFSLGAALAVVYRLLWIFFSDSAHIINSFSYVFAKPREAFLCVKNEFSDGDFCEKSLFSRQVFEFFFTLIATVGFIVFSYVFLDGCIRVFSAIAMVAAFFAILSVTRNCERRFLLVFKLSALIFVLPISAIFAVFRAVSGIFIAPFTHIVKKKVVNGKQLRFLCQKLPIDKSAKK